MTVEQQIHTSAMRIGTPDQEPFMLGEGCRRVMAEDVAKQMIREHSVGDRAVTVTLTPGVCRYCKKQLPLTHTEMDLIGKTILYPLYQCDRVASLHQAACDLLDRQQAARRQAEVQAAGKGQRGPAPTWTGNDF